MLSNSSSIAARRIQHRRQNSTPAIFEATQVRPLPANVQRQIGHRRGLSLEGRPMYLGQHRNTNQTVPQDGPQSVSIDTNYRQQQSQQTPTQVAHQHSQPQPGSQVQEIPQTPLVSSSQYVGDISPHDTESQEKKQRLVQEKYLELQNALKELQGGSKDLQVNFMGLVTPDATPRKHNFPRGANVDFAPMPSLGEMKEIHLDAPMFDQNFNGLTSPTTDISYASSYCSDPSSPTHTHASPHSSPHNRAIHDFGQIGPISDEVVRQLFPLGQVILQPQQGGQLDNQFYSSNTLRAPSPQAIEIAGVQIDATIEHTGISAEQVALYISPQTPDGRWTCLWHGCGKDFGRRENIRAHVQTHLGDRQYKCNHCKKQFVRQHDLKRHAKIHTGDKSNKCPCGAGFARHDALTRHRQRGMCSGALEGVMRRNAKRGRPKKNRPEMEARVNKSARTRRAIASAASSVSASSPLSGSLSVDDDFSLDMSQYNDNYQSLDSQSEDRSDPFSLDSLQTTSPITQEDHSFSSSSHVAPDSTMMSRTTTQTTQMSMNSFDHTPPMSPSDSTSPASIPSPHHPSIEDMPNMSRIGTPPGSPCMQEENQMQSIDSLFDEDYFSASAMENAGMDAFINMNGTFDDLNYDPFEN